MGENANDLPVREAHRLSVCEVIDAASTLLTTPNAGAQSPRTFMEFCGSLAILNTTLSALRAQRDRVMTIAERSSLGACLTAAELIRSKNLALLAEHPRTETTSAFTMIVNALQDSGSLPLDQVLSASAVVLDAIADDLESTKNFAEIAGALSILDTVISALRSQRDVATTDVDRESVDAMIDVASLCDAAASVDLGKTHVLPILAAFGTLVVADNQATSGGVVR